MKDTLSLDRKRKQFVVVVVVLLVTEVVAIVVVVLGVKSNTTWQLFFSSDYEVEEDLTWAADRITAAPEQEKHLLW